MPSWRRGAKLDIPRSSDDLTPEWLTRSLRSRGHLTRGEISEVRREILGEGEGFVGEIVRLHLKLDPPGSDAPSTLIAKLPTTLAKNRALGELLQAYEREIRFYEELSSEVVLRTPHCYFSAMDPGPYTGREEQIIRVMQRFPVWLARALFPLTMWIARRSQRRYVLLLEDLAYAQLGDQVEGCTPEVAEDVLRELARAQAALWNSERFEPLFWLARIDLLPRLTHAAFRRNRKVFIRRFAEWSRAPIGGLLHWFDQNAIALMEHLGSPPLALLHGDYRLDNLFFSSKDDAPTLTAIDWQGVGCGRGPLEVAYFIAQNLESTLALQSERGLVRAYHDELTAGGMDGYSFGECWRDYELSKLFHVYRIVGGLELIDLSHARGQDLLRKILMRMEALLPTEDPDVLLAGLPEPS